VSATTIAGDIVARLERLGAQSELPSVRALHLPPPVAPGRDGEFCAIELEDGSLGLSYALLDDTRARLLERPGQERLPGAGALEVARRYAGSVGAARAIGLAAVNALTAWLFRRAGFTPGAAPDSIGLLEPRPGDSVGMIGLFPSLVERIVRSGARLTVVELKASLVGEREGYRVTLDAGALRACNKVLSTSSILLSDDVDGLVACCAGATTFALVGPGAGCLPDPLFERGVTLVGGAWVLDQAALREAITSGAPWAGSTRKCALRPEAYPGFEALVGRALRS
jgi:hypothetical protein